MEGRKLACVRCQQSCRWGLVCGPSCSTHPESSPDPVQAGGGLPFIPHYLAPPGGSKILILVFLEYSALLCLEETWCLQNGITFPEINLTFAGIKFISTFNQGPPLTFSNLPICIHNYQGLSRAAYWKKLISTVGSLILHLKKIPNTYSRELFICFFNVCFYLLLCWFP